MAIQSKIQIEKYQFGIDIRKIRQIYGEKNNDQSSYTEKSDVYSMGVLMWEALSNSEIPYSYIVDNNLVVKSLLFPLKPSTSYTFKLNVDVTRNGLLGGRFRKIYEAQWISRRKKSIILIEMSEAPTKHEVLFYNELNNHQDIINTFGFVENNFGTITLLQERASHGHFQELLKQKLFEPSSMVLIVIFLQIIDAMVYIVGKGMIHDDLRCSNVLVFQMDSSKPEENFVKLANFALA
ncbi:unnamed protein product [Rotaria sp. Silwood1]|nr:unnamed protein product [Rotaria sp. Silwood1]